MPLLLHILLDLFLLRNDRTGAVSEGSSAGFQAAALGLFGISLLALFVAVLWSGYA